MYPNRLWSIPSEDTVYLTFDDGPIEGVTPWVLDLLKEFDARATFFCIGKNIESQPDIYSRIQAEGHGVGNHTQHHLNGKKTNVETYLEDIVACDTVMQSLEGWHEKHRLFRPPYGRLKNSQAKAISLLPYKIVMWDVLSADFDTQLRGEDCLKNVLDHLQPGSIVVFHDSLKAEPRLRYCLPGVLEFIQKKGWKCDKINA